MEKWQHGAVWLWVPLWAVCGATSLLPAAVTAGTLSMSYGQSCATTSSNHLYCWGGGVPSMPGALRPVHNTDIPEAIAVATAEGTLCAVTPQGEIRCVGQITHGNGLEGFVDVDAGSQAACGLKADGSVRCWGGFHYISDFNGNEYQHSLQFPYSQNLGAPAVALSVGRYRACAVTTTGRVKCWSTPYPSTTVVPDEPGIEGARSVAVPNGHMASYVAGTRWDYCASLQDGSVKCAHFGGEAVSVSGFTDVARVYDAGDLPCGVTEAGELQCVASDWSEATPKPGLTGAAREVSGLSHAPCARLSSGVIQCLDTFNSGMGPGIFPYPPSEDPSPRIVHLTIRLAEDAQAFGCSGERAFGNGFEPSPLPLVPADDLLVPGSRVSLPVSDAEAHRWHGEVVDWCGASRTRLAASPSAAGVDLRVPYLYMPSTGRPARSKATLRLFRDDRLFAESAIVLDDLPYLEPATHSGVVTLEVLLQMRSVAQASADEWLFVSQQLEGEAAAAAAEIAESLLQQVDRWEALRAQVYLLRSGQVSRIVVPGSEIALDAHGLDIMDRVFLYAMRAATDGAGSKTSENTLLGVRGWFQNLLTATPAEFQAASDEMGAAALVIAGTGAALAAVGVVAPSAAAAAIFAAAVLVPAAVSLVFQAAATHFNEQGSVSVFDQIMADASDSADRAHELVVAYMPEPGIFTAPLDGARETAALFAARRNALLAGLQDWIADGPANPVPCNGINAAGNDDPFSTYVHLGDSPQGTLQVSYDMQSVPDRLIVTYGLDTQFDTGCTSGTGMLSVPVNPDFKYLRVQMLPSCDGSTGTAWSFSASCPN